MVTAEFAVAILAALSLMITLVAGVQLVVLQIRCIDTAAEVARQAARGDAAAVAAARRQAPAGADIGISRTDELVSVSVVVWARPLAEALPAVRLTATAAVVPEPAAAQPGAR